MIDATVKLRFHQKAQLRTQLVRPQFRLIRASEGSEMATWRNPIENDRAGGMQTDPCLLQLLEHLGTTLFAARLLLGRLEALGH